MPSVPGEPSGLEDVVYWSLTAFCGLRADGT